MNIGGSYGALKMLRPRRLKALMMPRNCRLVVQTSFRIIPTIGSDLCCFSDTVAHLKPRICGPWMVHARRSTLATNLYSAGRLGWPKPTSKMKNFGMAKRSPRLLCTGHGRVRRKKSTRKKLAAKHQLKNVLQQRKLFGLCLTFLYLNKLRSPAKCDVRRNLQAR